MSVVDTGNGLLWGSVLIYLLIGLGLYFTVRSGFIQFRNFGHMFKLMADSRNGASGGISSFQAFSTSLAARVGTGNMAGVAVALYLGGPGAIFLDVVNRPRRHGHQLCRIHPRASLQS